jgi:hypothetical protein
MLPPAPTVAGCYVRLFLLSFLVATLAAGPRASETLATAVGVPEVVGGPTCCLFDSPFLGLATSAGTVGLSANSDTFVVSLGASVSSQLAQPLPTGLAADSDNTSYSHCGKWLNAAFVDPANASIVHGFFHQEWHCDYAHALYTNKSVGYAQSVDGGLTFVPVPTPSGADPAADQLVASSNTTAAHQTGEGDHGVVRIGDYLYMLFVCWDGDVRVHGGTTAAMARSRVADGGRPGTWFKYFQGAWSQPAVGGRSDAVLALPGTAVYALPSVSPSTALAVGVIFSAALNVAWADGAGADAAPTDWAPAAAGPIFNAAWASWDRNANSSELFGYPGLTAATGGAGGAVAPDASFVYFTYLSPGHDFTARWLVRRPLRVFARAGGGAAPPALSALALWASTTAPAAARRWWAAGGPVAPDAAPGNFSAVRTLGAVLTAAQPGALALHECAAAPGAVALALDGECGAGALAAGAVLRSPGWLAPTAAAAAGLGWASVVYAGGGGPTMAADPAPLWRCRGAGAFNFSAALGAAACAADAGFEADRLLGFVLAGLPGVA